jgi:hypothetical protein
MNTAFANHVMRALTRAVDGMLMAGNSRVSASNDRGKLDDRAHGQWGSTSRYTTSDPGLLAE